MIFLKCRNTNYVIQMTNGQSSTAVQSEENNERLQSDYLNRSESLGQLGAADWVL